MAATNDAIATEHQALDLEDDEKVREDARLLPETTAGHTSTATADTSTTSTRERRTESLSNLTFCQLLQTKELKPLLYYLGGLATLLTILAIIAAVFAHDTVGALVAFAHWVKRHLVLGSFVFICSYAVGSVLMMPAAPVVIAAGFIYAEALGQLGGIFVGTLVVFCGSFLGAGATFLLVRNAMRSKVEGVVRRWTTFAVMDELVKLNGAKVVVLLRMSWLVPYNFLNCI